MPSTRLPLEAVFFCAALLLGLSVQASAQGRPAKLAVKFDKRTVQVGESFQVEVGLFDVRNAPVSAPKDFQISLDVRLPSGGSDQHTLALRRGQGSASIGLSLTEPGINRLRARHPELREGGGSVMVRPPGRSSLRARELVVAAPPRPESSPAMPSPVRGVRPPARAGAASSPGLQPRGLDAPEPVDTSESEPAVVDTGGAIPTQPAPGAAAPSALPPPPEAGNAVLELDFSPQRKLLADGRDEATISAFLTPGSGLDREVEVQLHNSDGTLEPRVLRFPRGEWVADSILTSGQPGQVTVRPVGVPPTIEVGAPGQLNLDFGPPIYESKIAAGPRELTFLDQTEISIELFDHNGLPVKTDEPREIHLTLMQGSGHLESTDLLIPAGRSNASTTFTPTSWGRMVLSASTPGLQTVETDPPLAVTFPFLVLSLSAGGGLLGGVVAFWTRKPSHWWRIIVGAITGLLLFGIIDLGLLAVFPAVAVANPLGAFVLAAIGGWMGTEVLDLGRKRLVLGSRKSGA